MKKTIIYSIAALALFAGLVSCEKSSGPEFTYPNAVVTLKSHPETGRFYMQLDDKTTLLPVNVEKNPYEKEVRAFVNYSETDADPKGFSKAVNLNAVDTILTKMMAPFKGSNEENFRTYGQDPIEITKQAWPTVIEDGYLTVVIRTVFSGYMARPHEVNLVRGEQPGEIILCHDAKGDVYGNYWASNVVAFRLSDLGDLGEISPEGTTLTLKWNGFNGDRKETFTYIPRKDDTSAQVE